MQQRQRTAGGSLSPEQLLRLREQALTLVTKINERLDACEPGPEPCVERRQAIYLARPTGKGNEKY